MGFIINPYSFGAATPISNSFLQLATDNAAGTVHTYSTQNLGTADGTRRIVCAVHWLNAASITSLTIAGVTATAHVSQLAGSNGTRAALYSALVPTGTTGNVVITFPTSTTRTGIALWRQINESSGSPFATATTTVNATSISTTINVPSNGSLYAAVDETFGTSGTNTWTGATERYDSQASGDATTQYSGASETGLGSQTGRSISSALTGIGGDAALVVMTWG